MCDVGCKSGATLRCVVRRSFLAFTVVVLFCILIQIRVVYGFFFARRTLIVFKFDLVVEIAGVGGVEDGDGAAAFFVRGLGFVQRVD